MLRPRNARLPLSLGILTLLLAATNAYAHTVKTNADIAATFHLEPDHNPRAGEPAQVWFALTRKGGEVLPLDECDCQLTVYVEPRAADADPLLIPELTSLDVERYEGIPAAEVVFPDPGAYVLVISGRPKTVGEFQPFSLAYDVTVGR